MKKYYLLSIFLWLFSAQILAEQSRRWYSDGQANKGRALFLQNCASCHGPDAEATVNWKQTDANGNYPPPPLNGTAHAWHHDIELLRKTVREGGQKLGGVMPPFSDKLSKKEIDLVIAYFQSKWPDDLYQKWAGRFDKTTLPSLNDIVEARNNSITRLLKKRLGNSEIDEPSKTAVDGVWQVKLQNRFLYLMDEGKYALIGDLINLESGENLTNKERRGFAVDTLSKYGDNDLVVFNPQGETKATLNVFTDTSCPYCRKLHEEVPKLIEAGIKIRYLPFARGGKNGPGYQTLKSVWCADDRNSAMTDAKNRKVDELPEGSCESAKVVDQAYITGNQVGVTGTPALFKQNGEKIEGYVPYQKLIPMVLN